ncbi:hypothetical protein [Streptomyces sp. 5-10]|uniref:hypothetical protein n=1 Tax=Streptomyces sp. 5-10 TaxID=878925 RepID=UPI003519DA7E
MRAHDDAETLLDAASALLGEALAAPDDAVASYYAVNTCSWPRTETARLFLPESTVALDEAVQVLDARTGTPLRAAPLDYAEFGNLRAEQDDVTALLLSTAGRPALPDHGHRPRPDHGQRSQPDSRAGRVAVPGSHACANR